MNRRLHRLDLSYEVDVEGDYRISVTMEDGGEMTVGLAGYTILLEDGIRIREIWSVAARITGEMPNELAGNLMADSWSSRKLGSWAIAGRTSDGRTVLVYLARIPEDSTAKFLLAAINDVAYSAYQIQKALAGLEEL